MVLKSDKEKVKTLLSETIRLLCKNGLHFKSEFSVEALVGITLDKDQEFFLSIKETVKTDIPLPKPESRSQKEARRSSAKEVKGEPNEPPSCVRKRPSETVTNNGSPSDLPPSLSLGDMHDNESGFWGPEGDDGGGQATKKKRIDPNDDDSNSNVITIKGEPGSDSDDDVACMGESSDRDSQMDQTMGDMSGSFMYATPVTSEQSMMGGLPPGGSMPQGVWDHLPQFPIPGPSGMAGGADVSQDGQQVVLSGEGTIPRHFRELLSHYSFETVKSKLGIQSFVELGILRLALLTKGSFFTSSRLMARFNNHNRPSPQLVREMMLHLSSLGLGEVKVNGNSFQFIKLSPSEIDEELVGFCGVSLKEYSNRFIMGPNVQPNPELFAYSGF